MMAFSEIPPEEIRKMDAETLGLAGFCFMAAELLALKYPASELCRLTGSDRKGFAHVFVCVRGRQVDINGFRDVVMGMRERLNDPNLFPEVVPAKAAHDFFCRCFKPDQLAAAREVLSRHIEENPRLFPDRPELSESTRR